MTPEKVTELAKQAGLYDCIVFGRIESKDEVIQRFAELVRSEVLVECESGARHSPDIDHSVDKFVGAYCEAWEQSFLADNPYHTVHMSSEDKKHIEAGLIAVLRRLKK